MGRWADQDSDEERLPEGYTRIGYDADSQTYTFRSPSGIIYESEPGNRYGDLYPQGQRPERSAPEIEVHNVQLKKSNRDSVKMMLPFALLVLVFLLLMFRMLNGGSADDGRLQVHCGEGTHEIYVKDRDTCWQIAKTHGLGVEELLDMEGNQEIDCSALRVGQALCVPQ